MQLSVVRGRTGTLWQESIWLYCLQHENWGGLFLTIILFLLHHTSAAENYFLPSICLFHPKTYGDVILKAKKLFSSTEFVSVSVSALGWRLMRMWLQEFLVSPSDQPESPEPLQLEGLICQPASSGQTADRWSHLQVRAHISSCIFHHVYKSQVRLQHFNAS